MKLLNNIVIAVFIISTSCLSDWRKSNFPSTISLRAMSSIGSTLIAAGANENIYRSRNNGEIWDSTALPMSYILAFHVEGSDFYAGGVGGLFVSHDTAKTFTKIWSGNDIVESISTTDSNIFIGTAYNAVSVKKKNDTTWKVIDSGLTNKRVFAIHSIGRHVIAGTQGGGIFRLSSDENFWIVSQNSPNYSEMIRSSSGVTFATSDESGILKSLDSGATWVNSGLSRQGTYNILLVGSHVFAGSIQSGVHYSSDTGNNWRQINENLGDLDIRATAIIGENIFAATYSTGIWTRSLSEFTTLSVKMPPNRARANSFRKILMDNHVYCIKKRSEDELFKPITSYSIDGKVGSRNSVR